MTTGAVPNLVNTPTKEERLARGQAFSLALPAVLLAAITLLGLGLRLYRLDGRSLWLDELVTAWVTRFDGLWQVFDFLRYWPDNTPFIYVQAWLLRGLGGGEWAVRLPYAIQGALTVPAIYLLGRALWGRRLGLLAALIMAVIPFAVWYSQEARSYAPLMLFTTLQALFAYHSATRSHLLDWLGLALFTVLNLYTSYLAIAVTGTLAAYIASVLLADVLALRRTEGGERASSLRRIGARVALALAAAGLVILVFLPWVPSLQAFLSRHDLGFGLVPADRAPSLDDLYGRLYELGILGPLLVAVLVGGVVCAVAVVRGQWRKAALPLLLVLVPLAGYWVSAGMAMVQLAGRYYSVIFPALVLLAAVGIGGASAAAGALVSRLWNWWPRAKNASRSGHRAPAPGRGYRSAADIAFWVFALLVLTQASTWTASAYALPKPDYRGTAAYIREHSPSGGVVLALGAGPIVFFPESLQYYLDLGGARVDVQDGRMLNYTAASTIAAGGGAVWAAYYHELSPEQVEQARAQGLEVMQFMRITLLRNASGGSAAEQARALLRWGSAWEPRLNTSIGLIDAVEGRAALGDDLLPPPSNAAVPQGVDFMKVVSGQVLPGGETGRAGATWALWWPSRVAPDGRGIMLSVSGQQVNATATTQVVRPGATYLLTFRCGQGSPDVSRQVFASVHDRDNWLDTFPTGTGYRCMDGGSTEGFAFTVPHATRAVAIWLRASGTGTAEFSDVRLREIR